MVENNQLNEATIYASTYLNFLDIKVLHQYFLKMIS